MRGTAYHTHTGMTFNTAWSVDELAVLYTLHAGVPGRYGLRCTTSWCDLMVCLFPHQWPTS